MNTRGIIGVLWATCGLATGQASDLLLVCGAQGGVVSCLDPASGAVDHLVRVGAGPEAVLVSPDGRFAVVSNHGEGPGANTLGILDLEHHRLGGLIPLELERRQRGGERERSTFHRPAGLAWLEPGEVLLVCCEEEAALLFVDVKLRLVLEAVSTGQRQSHAVLVSRDGRRAFVSNRGSGTVSVIDTQRRRLAATIDVGAGCSGLALHPSGSELWVANSKNDSISVVDMHSLEEVEEFPCGSHPLCLEFTPDGTHVLCANQRSGTLTVYDAARRRVVTQVRLEGPAAASSRTKPAVHSWNSATASALPSDILIPPGGKLAFVSCARTGRIAVLETSRWSVRSYLEVGGQPHGLAWLAIAD